MQEKESIMVVRCELKIPTDPKHFEDIGLALSNFQ